MTTHTNNDSLLRDVYDNKPLLRIPNRIDPLNIKWAKYLSNRMAKPRIQRRNRKVVQDGVSKTDRDTLSAAINELKDAVTQLKDNDSRISKRNWTQKMIAVVAVLGLVISLFNSYNAYQVQTVLNNYQPSVEIRDASSLFLNENCSPVRGTTKNCTLSGDFSLSLGITSPHAGIYNVSIVSFSPSITPMYSLRDVSFLGKNLTLVDFVVGNGSYVIKVRNETSGHFIYFVNIGGVPPGQSIFINPMEIVGSPERNVPANGFEKTINVTIESVIARPADYNGTSGKVRIGTLTGNLTYIDVPTRQGIQKPFVIEVWMNPSSG